jgi:hypothetical protein
MLLPHLRLAATSCGWVLRAQGWRHACWGWQHQAQGATLLAHLRLVASSCGRCFVRRVSSIHAGDGDSRHAMECCFSPTARFRPSALGSAAAGTPVLVQRPQLPGCGSGVGPTLLGTDPIVASGGETYMWHHCWIVCGHLHLFCLFVGAVARFGGAFGCTKLRAKALPDFGWVDDGDVSSATYLPGGVVDEPMLLR